MYRKSDYEQQVFKRIEYCIKNQQLPYEKKVEIISNFFSIDKDYLLKVPSEYFVLVLLLKYLLYFFIQIRIIKVCNVDSWKEAGWTDLISIFIYLCTCPENEDKSYQQRVSKSVDMEIKKMNIALHDMVSVIIFHF